MSILPLSFYQRDDVVQISRDLIGKWLFTKEGEGEITGGMIVETEAYAGPIDRASHAYGNRRTPRTEIMYSDGGVSYVYLCYGIHHLFNVITNIAGIPHAVLIRAIEPKTGIDLMLERRNRKHLDEKLAAGPGSLTKALGITHDHNGIALIGSSIWLEDRKNKPFEIITSPRVGIDYAGEDALLPWRFRLANSPWTSN